MHIFLYNEHEGDNMCGRFTITVSYDELVEHLSSHYEIEDVSLFDLPRYNVAPSQEIISVLSDGAKYRAGYLKWGFIRPFSKNDNIEFSLINAKSETIFEKKSFMDAARHRRCVVLADSFYEWHKDSKMPMRIYLKHQKLFAMAGLWTTYKKDDGTKIHTVTILTTEANELMKDIHERMPVILTKASEHIWLNPSIKDESILKPLLKPYVAEDMDMYPVSKVVNSVKEDHLSCIEPLDTKKQQDLFS